MSKTNSDNQMVGFVGRPMTACERSFDAGYRYGLSDGAVELSNREIETRFPDITDTIAFAQGMLDGLAGDDWRHRCMAEHVRERNNMDSVLIMEMVERSGYMEQTIGHGRGGGR